MLDNSTDAIKKEIIRYLSFWPFLFVLLFALFISSYIYLRYASYVYETTAVIEIYDEAQDSEMALPTELTVFNRSMINLENEVNVLNSFSLHSRVVKQLKSNILYFNVGSIKTSNIHQEYWYDDYEINFNINTDTVTSSKIYKFNTTDNELFIDEFDYNDNLINAFVFKDFNTNDQEHSLPFDLTINNIKNPSERILRINPIDGQVKRFMGQFQAFPLGNDSDQLVLKISNNSKRVAEEYLNALLVAFDNDGIRDRQLEYRRTIEFVNTREIILKKELEVIELRKQNFKQKNNLSDIKLDAGNNIDLKFTYNTQLFNSESQKNLANYLLESMNNPSYEYLPINIGIEDFDINSIISNYNNLVAKRNQYISETGPNNIFVKTIDSQLEDITNNISNSLKNYLKTIEIQINNLRKKESEFSALYDEVPENEKVLRSIERELTIKEALYLLLLQKREEAAINLAVVKPTIKVIDYPISNSAPISPKPRLIYLGSLVGGILIFYLILYLWFFFDNKIHNKEQLNNLLDDIPIICEIPFIKDEDELSVSLKINNQNTRSILNESIRMLISNLKFMIDLQNNKSNTIIFTSSIKGEGKTLASVNTAINISNDHNKKVLLIGTDLRNPQIHKIFGLNKNQRGLSEILYSNDVDNYKNYLSNHNNLDVIFSGSIPPNPTALLASKAFEKLMELVKKNYDYIIIDSAPCLLVSDTFEIIKYVDSIIYLFRANFTDKIITKHINELKTNENVKSFSVVLNAVGNSGMYGYKYGYQYGYKYGYKYGYNYGYGYGYGNKS